MKRVVIYVKDLMIITGKGERTCRDLHQKMKVHFGKEKHQCVSVEEVSQYLGLKAETIQKIL